MGAKKYLDIFWKFALTFTLVVQLCCSIWFRCSSRFVEQNQNCSGCINVSLLFYSLYWILVMAPGWLHSCRASVVKVGLTGKCYGQRNNLCSFKYLLCSVINNIIIIEQSICTCYNTLLSTFSYRTVGSF